VKLRTVQSARAQTRAFAFTLVEGLIGVAVMGTVFVSLYTGMASGFQSIRTSQENLRATQIMTEKFEAIRLFNWEQINTPGFVPGAFAARFAPNSSTSPGITYRGTIRIAGVVGQPYSVDLRSVTITLTWTSNGRTQNRTLTSYVARYGLQTYLY
jgi:type II secretory pathway pseudopilin PulG